MAADNLHSKFVGMAKIAFPLLALGFLSTIFLFSRTLDPSEAIPFSDVDVEQIANDQILSGPTFSGVTSDGSAIMVTAESARPNILNPRQVSAKNVMAQIMTVQETSYEITANAALFDGTNEDLDLEGDIVVTSSSGYELKTQHLSTSFGTTGLIAKGEVIGTAPEGTITAGRMEMLIKDGAQLLVFTNGVRLVYTPES